MTRHAHVCDAVRTPFGRYGGALSSVLASVLLAPLLPSIQQDFAARVRGFHLAGRRAAFGLRRTRRVESQCARAV